VGSLRSDLLSATVHPPDRYVPHYIYPICLSVPYSEHRVYIYIVAAVVYLIALSKPLLPFSLARTLSSCLNSLVDKEDLFRGDDLADLGTGRDIHHRRGGLRGGDIRVLDTGRLDAVCVESGRWGGRGR